MRRIALLLFLASCSGPEPFTVPPGAVGSATGFFVRGDGLLVTAAHAAVGCGGLEVASERLRRTPAQLVASDQATDLALLRTAGNTPPGTLGAAPGAQSPGDLVSLGYPVLGLASPLVEARPLPVEVRPASSDPRFARWWLDRRLDHGWSGAPVLDGARVVGVVLSTVTDPDEQQRLLGRVEPGLAAGAGAASVSALLARAGVGSASSGRARDAVVRVFCLR